MKSNHANMTFMKIFVVASDPGSANAIMPVIATCYKQGHLINGVVSGSATTLLSKWPEIEEIDDATTIEKILNIWADNRPQILLAGAGAYNLLEHTVRRAASDAGIPCIAVLDYWANYHQRFRRLDGEQWTYSLPDRICVLDEIVRNEMLTEGFASEKIVMTGQPYFEYILHWRNALSINDVTRFRNRYLKDEDSLLIGFCSEPIHKININDEFGYDQYSTIRKITTFLGQFTKLTGRRIHLAVRPHPRENDEKIKDVLASIQTSPMLSWEVSKIGYSMEFIVSCDLLIGMTSMALIEAFLLSKKVLSIQLNLKKTDVFFGTTRGYCPSIYDEQELFKWLEQWFGNQVPHSINTIPYNNGATKRTIAVMEELIEINKS